MLASWGAECQGTHHSLSLAPPRPEAPVARLLRNAGIRSLPQTLHRPREAAPISGLPSAQHPCSRCPSGAFTTGMETRIRGMRDLVLLTRIPEKERAPGAAAGEGGGRLGKGAREFGPGELGSQVQCQVEKEAGILRWMLAQRPGDTYLRLGEPLAPGDSVQPGAPRLLLVNR